jgi:NADPH2:quinone reductase
MKAIVAVQSKPVTAEDFLQEVEVAKPIPTAHEILVEVKAVAFNPVDYKRRQNEEFLSTGPKILGWDAAGIVRAVGSSVQNFSCGDEVFYAGELLKSGCNAEFQTVDARLVGKKPKKLSFAEAASLPLTSITAWEALFHKLKIAPLDDQRSILVLGGAGGVGSIAIQLLRQLTRSTVITTYSRPETSAWCSRMGAHILIDRARDLKSALQEQSINGLDYCFATAGSKQYAPQLLEALHPFSELCIIDDPENLDLFPYKMKSISIHWELMFTRSLYNYQPEKQGQILNQISALVDEGRITHTAHTILKGFTAKNFMDAHVLQESGTSIGKIVAEY